MILAAGPARLDAAFAAALTNARARFTTAAPGGTDRLAASDEAGPRMRTATSSAERQAATRTMIDTYIAHPTSRTARFLDQLAVAPTNPAAVGPMAAEMTSGLDLLANAPAITTPTLVLTGDLDVRVPTEHMQIIADTLPDAQLVRFPGLGHLTHIENPQRWVAAVSAFLRRRPVATLND